eukprot:TRINITY_DN69320_c0_g1_i1.p1 TRINITY_DN69320_c0_g1~~TRINITY_DN69320_c0_g1_i1.p1  ORF type:complete len:243 (-),score=29.18 TRINITY_DN69320_c0_g1_i1:16-744(-)
MSPQSFRLCPRDVGSLAALLGLASTVQAVIGFGGNMIFMPLAARFLAPADLVSSTWLPGVLRAILMLVSDRRHIDSNILFRRVLPWTLLGLGGGMQVASRLQGNQMRKLLGVFVTCVAGAKLFELFKKSTPEVSKKAEIPVAGLIAGGFFHGIYSTGGPPLVWAIGRADLDRDTFRSTLTANLGVLTLLQGAGLWASGKLTRGQLLLGTALLGSSRELHGEIHRDPEGIYLGSSADNVGRIR